jgi:hypothetical protein
MQAEATTTDALDAKQLLSVIVALRNGDFSARMPVENTGLPGKISDALNDVVELNAELVAELQRIRKEVGQEGKTKERGTLSQAAGGWKAAISAVMRNVLRRNFRGKNIHSHFLAARSMIWRIVPSD